MDMMYRDKDLIEDKLYELIDQFNKRNNFYHRNLYFALLNNMHPFYDGNESTFKVLFYLELEL